MKVVVVMVGVVFPMLLKVFVTNLVVVSRRDYYGYLYAYEGETAL